MRRADAHPFLTNLRSSGHRRKISGICSFWLAISSAIESMAMLQSSPALLFLMMNHCQQQLLVVNRFQTCCTGSSMQVPGFALLLHLGSMVIFQGVAIMLPGIAGDAAAVWHPERNGVWIKQFLNWDHDSPKQ